MSSFMVYLKALSIIGKANMWEVFTIISVIIPIYASIFKYILIMKTLYTKLLSLFLLGLTFNSIDSNAQNVLQFYDSYGSSTTPITKVEVFLDSVSVKSYSNDLGSATLFDGDIEYQVHFPLFSSSPDIWTFKRDMVCDTNFSFNFEAPCANGSCYLVPTDVFGNLEPSHVCPQDITNNIGSTGNGLKLGFMGIDLTKKGSYHATYSVGTGSRDANGVFTFDNNHAGSIDFIVHVNGGSCSGNPLSLVNNTKDKVKFNIFPNPVVGNQLNISILESTGIHNYLLRDITGHVISTGQSESENFSIDLAYEMTNGVYFLQIENAKTGFTALKKVVLNR